MQDKLLPFLFYKSSKLFNSTIAPIEKLKLSCAANGRLSNGEDRL